jgi:hypothetical protein
MAYQSEFKWNVQPLEFIKDLEAAYLKVVITGTRGKAEQRAAQATKWMRDNAPWTDRPAYLRRRRMVDADTKKVSYERITTPHARTALKAFIKLSDADKAENAQIKAASSQAYRNDRLKLKNLNATRKEAGKRLLKKLPIKESEVAQYEKYLRSTRVPLVDITFAHSNKNIRYAIWLEVANQGRFSIIAPAIEYWGRILMNDIKQIANLKQYGGFTFGDEDNTLPSTPEVWSPTRRQRRIDRRPEYERRKAREAIDFGPRDKYGELPSRERELEIDAFYRKYPELEPKGPYRGDRNR